MGLLPGITKMLWNQMAVMVAQACPGGSVVKKLHANVGDASSIPGSGRFPRRRKWQPAPVFLPGKSPGQRPGKL